MVKPILIQSIILLTAFSFAAQIKAQNCADAGYQDRSSSERSILCSNKNRCCNDNETERIGELFRMQRERCWTDDFENSRQSLNAFFEQYQGLIKNIVQSSATVSFGSFETTPNENGDYYDVMVLEDAEQIGEFASDYVQGIRNIDQVQSLLETSICGLLASRLLTSRYAELQQDYAICGACLCARIRADNSQLTLKTLVRDRVQNAWMRYSRHLQRLRTIYVQIENISSETGGNQEISQLCNSESIRLLGCRRCAGYNEGACSSVCSSLFYFCREAYRRVVLIHQNAPRNFLGIARAFQGSGENNEFSTDNARETVALINTAVSGMVANAFEALNMANRDIPNINDQVCFFATITNITNNSTGNSLRKGCPNCNDCSSCKDECAINRCKKDCGKEVVCQPPFCNEDEQICFGEKLCKCKSILNDPNKCSGKRRRDVGLVIRSTDAVLSNYVLMFQNLAEVAYMRGMRVNINSIFQRDCVCGSTLNQYREIALGTSDTCYNPLGDFTLNENDFRDNPVYRSLSTSQQIDYQNGASVEALENDLNAFEMEVMEGSNAIRMSYSIVIVLITLVLTFLYI